MVEYIEKQAAIDAIRASRMIYSGTWGKGLVMAEERLRDLPSAQPERIRGRWIEKPHVYGVAYCSLCDYELHTNDTNFCPNCGADMRGEQE